MTPTMRRAPRPCVPLLPLSPRHLRLCHSQERVRQVQTAVSAAERDVQDFYLSVLRHFVDALSAHLAALPPGTDPAHDSDAARGMWFYRTSGHLREFLRRYYLSIKVPPRSTSAPHSSPVGRVGAGSDDLLGESGQACHSDLHGGCAPSLRLHCRVSC